MSAYVNTGQHIVSVHVCAHLSCTPYTGHRVASLVRGGKDGRVPRHRSYHDHVVALGGREKEEREKEEREGRREGEGGEGVRTMHVSSAAINRRHVTCSGCSASITGTSVAKNDSSVANRGLSVPRNGSSVPIDRNAASINRTAISRNGGRPQTPTA
eukprot:2627037-Rhodomonas_salina.2